jgi:hypothetical protein
MKTPDSAPEPSVLPQTVIDLFKAALSLDGWIEDKVADQFLRRGDKNGSGMDSQKWVTGQATTDDPSQKKRGNSKSVVEQPAKRQRADEC